MGLFDFLGSDDSGGDGAQGLDWAEILRKKQEDDDRKKEAERIRNAAFNSDPKLGLMNNPDSQLPDVQPPPEGVVTSSADAVAAKHEAPPDIEEPTLSNKYSDWLKRQPKEADYQPGRGRKIIGAILGGLTALNDPKQGMEIGGQIINDKYNRARSEWDTEGKALGEVRPLEQSRLMGERWRDRNQTTERGQDVRAATATADRAQRSRAEADRYETENRRIDVMGDENARKVARDANDAKHDSVMEGIYSRQAATGETNAATAQGNLEQRKAEEEGRNARATAAQGKPLSPSQEKINRQMAARDMASQYPDYVANKFLVKNDKGQWVAAVFDPETMDMGEYETFFREYERRGKRR